MIAEHIAKELSDCYYIGGVVRDYITNKPYSEVELITTDTYSDIIRKFKNVKFIDKYFIIDQVKIKTYSDFKSELNRDFSINSIAMDTNLSIFCLGSGIQDLENKIVRFNNNSLKKIYEDPLRMVSGCRLVSEIGGKFSPDTQYAIQSHTYLMSLIRPERIRDEILMAMKTKASLFFKNLYHTNLLGYIFPEMVRCYKHTHSKYHSEDIFTHLMLVGDNISDPLIGLAGYLHDIGKPITYPDFKGHEIVSADLAYKYLTELKFHKNDIMYICNLIQLHMLSLRNPDYKNIKEKLKAKGVNYKDFIKLKVADRIGNLGKGDYSSSEINNFIDNLKD